MLFRSGMIDESFDTEQMKQPEQPYEFRSKPAWQRLLIMIGGVLMNFFYNKKNQRIIAGVIAGLLILAMVVTTVFSV